MNTHGITFSLNNKTNLIIPLQDPVEWLGPMYEEDIMLFHNNTNVLLSKGTIYHDMIQLADLLKKVLRCQLLLHSSITTDIGYLYNEYHHDETGFTMHLFPGGVSSWIGYLYHLWEGTSDTIELITWIYNKPDGSIIFEATPFYPYMYCEPEEEPDYIPYKEWIKAYKPYFITTLSRKTAQEWLEQAGHIIKIVEDNQKRWDQRTKENIDL